MLQHVPRLRFDSGGTLLGWEKQTNRRTDEQTDKKTEKQTENVLNIEWHRVTRQRSTHHRRAIIENSIYRCQIDRSIGGQLFVQKWSLSNKSQKNKTMLA
eukprot:Selendium_serpulae@DN76_c0_g1_i1.p1